MPLSKANTSQRENGQVRLKMDMPAIIHDTVFRWDYYTFCLSAFVQVLDAFLLNLGELCKRLKPTRSHDPMFSQVPVLHPMVTLGQATFSLQSSMSYSDHKKYRVWQELFANGAAFEYLEGKQNFAISLWYWPLARLTRAITRSKTSFIFMNAITGYGQ